MLALLLTTCPVLADGAVEDDPYPVSARIEATSLDVGASIEVILTTPSAGDAEQHAGIPTPILQLDVPPSLKPKGRVLESYEELAKNEFLEAPYERMLQAKEERVEFEVVAAPGKDERLALNVIAYLRGGEGESDSFIRRRIELPVALDATGSLVDPTVSSWGPESERLQIGAKAPNFSLPRADGSEFELASVLGDGWVIVSTYRAFW